jgi:hypothetical protein
MKNIQMISIRINPLSAQAGKPVPPDSLGWKTLLQEALLTALSIKV